MDYILIKYVILMYMEIKEKISRVDYCEEL